MRKGGLYLAVGDSTVYNNLQNLDNWDGSKSYAGRLTNWISDNYGAIKHLNKGLSGSTTRQWATYMMKWGTTFEPDLVTIGLSMNDQYNSIPSTETQTNLQTLINRFKRNNPDVIIILCTPNTIAASNPNGYTDDTVLNPFRAVFDTLATNNTNVFVCHFENAWNTAQCGANTVDNLHPNGTGHGLLFNQLQPILQANASTWLNSLGK
jgi:lysophospholipase L1-like esterase